MLLHALYERLCTALLNRLPCFGALEVIVTLLVLLLLLIQVCVYVCLLLTPRYYLSTYRRRAFSYAGPSAWNSLPEHLRAPDLTLNSFRHLLKTFLFTQMTHAAH